ncbi:MAG TPA: GNAT family protein [Drouetiella sp.]
MTDASKDTYELITLKTARCTLREFTSADLAAVHEYAQDAETTKYLDWGPNSLKDTTVFLNESLGFQLEIPRTTFDMAVISDAENRLVGASSVTIIDRENKVGALGYVINRKYWGSGYASEAAAALARFAFEQLHMEKLLATCDSLNVASEKVMRNIGMTLEQKFARHKFMKGKYRDELLYSVTRDDWAAHLRNRSR